MDDTRKSGMKKRNDASDKLVADLIARRKDELAGESQRLVASLLKRKEVLGENFKFENAHRTIFEDQHLEIREYPPHKRTLQVNTKGYDKNEKIVNKTQSFHLQLPYTIFATMRRHPRYGNGLYLGFRTSPLISIRNNLIFPTLPNTHANLMVCEGSGGGHDFDSRIQNYWASIFQTQEIPDGMRQIQRVFHTMDLWSEVDIDEVNYRLGIYGTRIPLFQTAFGFGIKLENDPHPIENEEWAFMNPPADVRGNVPWLMLPAEDDPPPAVKSDDIGRLVSKKGKSGVVEAIPPAMPFGWNPLDDADDWGNYEDEEEEDEEEDD